MTTVLTTTIEAEFVRTENAGSFTGRTGDEVAKADCVLRSMTDVRMGEFMATAFGKIADSVTTTLSEGVRIMATIEVRSNNYDRRDGKGAGWRNSLTLKSFKTLNETSGNDSAPKSNGPSYVDEEEIPF